MSQRVARRGALYTGKIAFGPLVGVPPKPTIVTAGGAINWDKDANSTDPIVSRDLTGMTSSSGGCPASTTREFLEGSDDWALLQLNLRASTDFLDGVTASFDPSLVDGTVDVNVEDALALSGDLIDIKPNDPTNTVRAMSSATVNVAIFSREGVDTTTIDPDTVTLRGLPPGPDWVLAGEAEQRLQGAGCEQGRHARPRLQVRFSCRTRRGPSERRRPR